ncbi:MAG TPA: hypothetical protein VN643_23135 [Pyrinomonadaceae bacterium]|nr:hypothetical protein [Pyrinomonadaceae bacterium]
MLIANRDQPNAKAVDATGSYGGGSRWSPKIVILHGRARGIFF